jgi:hypothetical protein
MKEHMTKLICCLLVTIGWFTGAATLQAQDWQRVVDLRGTWKFSLGDDADWAREDFNDREWDNIFVPSGWEDEGFPGYDGYAWYRRNFKMQIPNSERNLYLNAGYIDDVDEVYVNGNFVGFSGSFPPKYSTAYNQERIYRLPKEYLNPDGNNVICIRVYDSQQFGGIVRGRIGIYERQDDLPLVLSLEGFWKFSPHDDMDWKESDYDDSDWKKVVVPGPWETQGFRNYDGFAWYRKKIVIPEKLRNEFLVLLLGKIDDLDETYLNGKRIGRTGNMKDGRRISASNEWQEFRAYELEPDDILFGETNVIAVRVYDGQLQGGIYEGPIGITSYKAYKNWSREYRVKWEEIFEQIFR